MTDRYERDRLSRLRLQPQKNQHPLSQMGQLQAFSQLTKFLHQFFFTDALFSQQRL
jgi:hypothetical protein